MKRRLLFTKKASAKQVLKTLALLGHNIRHPGLKTHQHTSLCGDNGESIWEAYVQNNTRELIASFFTTAPTKS